MIGVTGNSWTLAKAETGASRTRWCDHGLLLFVASLASASCGNESSSRPEPTAAAGPPDGAPVVPSDKMAPPESSSPSRRSTPYPGAREASSERAAPTRRNPPPPVVNLPPRVAIASPLRVVVARTAGPWRGIWDTKPAEFALYADGHLVVAAKPPGVMRCAKLSKKQADALWKKLLPNKAYFGLEDYYHLSRLTDGGRLFIHVWQGTTKKTVSVYSGLGDIKRNGPEALAVLVGEAFAMARREDLFEPCRVGAWEVVAMPSRVADPDTAAVWPERWPLPEEGKLWQRRGTSTPSRRFHLPLEEARALRWVLRSNPLVQDKDAWHVTYRHVLPGHHLWDSERAEMPARR